MSNRFATTEQIDEVTNLAEEIAEYRRVVREVVKNLAGWIEAYSPDSGLEVRYITSEGRDDERWRGALLSRSPDENKVDVFCLTVTMSEMLALGNDEATGSFDKPISVGIDYYFDYEFGADSVEDEEGNIAEYKNSEDFFNDKVDGLEYILEQKRTCLPHNAEIVTGLFRRMIKQFSNASTHIAKGDFSIKIEGL